MHELGSPWETQSGSESLPQFLGRDLAETLSKRVSREPLLNDFRMLNHDFEWAHRVNLRNVGRWLLQQFLA